MIVTIQSNNNLKKYMYNLQKYEIGYKVLLKVVIGYIILIQCVKRSIDSEHNMIVTIHYPRII